MGTDMVAEIGRMRSWSLDEVEARTEELIDRLEAEVEKP
jgi:hypothetical protein